MKPGDTKQPDANETGAKTYESPVVVATYSVEELRRAAAVSAASTPPV